jgi:hypothetical protein
MNSSATSRALCAGLAAIALLGAGCTPSSPPEDVDQVRRDAMTQVEALQYLSSRDEMLGDINRSVDPVEIRNLARVAGEEDAQTKSIYWECAAGVPDLLHGAWVTSGQTAEPAEGQERTGNMYLLVTLPTTSASLTVDGSGWWLSDQPQTELEAWFENNTDKVTAWSSDLEQVIAAQEYRATAPPYAVSRNGCDTHFTLTLSAKTGDRSFDARFVRSGAERYLVLDDALQLDPEE